MYLHIESILLAIEYVYVSMIGSSLVRSYCKMFAFKLVRLALLDFGRKQMSSSVLESFKLFPWCTVFFVSAVLKMLYRAGHYPISAASIIPPAETILNCHKENFSTVCHTLYMELTNKSKWVFPTERSMHVGKNYLPEWLKYSATDKFLYLLLAFNLQNIIFFKKVTLQPIEVLHTEKLSSILSH